MKDKIEMVKELIALAEENDLAELSVDYKGFKVEIKKEEPLPATVFQSSVSPVAASSQEIPKSAKDATSAAEKTPDNSVAVKSPLSGTFYEASKPGAPAFVTLGESVAPGKILCIVEAMKLMNEIAAEQKGKIVKICKTNGEPVSEGEALFYMEPL